MIDDAGFVPSTAVRRQLLAVPLLLTAVLGVGGSATPAAAADEQTSARTARNACAALVSGGDARHVAHDVAVHQGVDDADARVLLRAAVHATCPANDAWAG